MYGMGVRVERNREIFGIRFNLGYCLDTVLVTCLVAVPKCLSKVTEGRGNLGSQLVGIIYPWWKGQAV